MQEKSLGKLNILIAVYGFKIVTGHINSLVAEDEPQTLNFPVNNKAIGEDGWHGQKKSIIIVYNYDGGSLQVATAREGDILTIGPDKPRISPLVADTPADNNSLCVLAASYGPDDVTYKVQKLISADNILSFIADNTIFGDTWYGVAKTLVIVLGSGNEVKGVEIFAENELCYLDLNEVIQAL